MRIDQTSSKCATMRAVLVAALALVALMGVAVSEAEQPSSGKTIEARTGRNLRPLPGPRSACVPGEVIVKLRDVQTGGFGLLSMPVAGGQEGVLLRLKSAYGLYGDRPVTFGQHFKR